MVLKLARDAIVERTLLRPKLGQTPELEHSALGLERVVTRVLESAEDLEVVLGKSTRLAPGRTSEHPPSVLRKDRIHVDGLGPPKQQRPAKELALLPRQL